jgi:hypothetical protein
VKGVPYHPETMPFGEHRGLGYYELAMDHPDYCRELLRQAWLDPRIAAHIRDALDEVATDLRDPEYDQE